MAKTLLLIDDEAPILRALKRLFRRSGYTLLTAESAEEGLALCMEHSPQVVLSDFMLPGMNGSELLQKTAELVPAPVGILLSGHAELNLVLEALNSGQVFKFITKPWQDAELLQQVERGFELFERQQVAPFVPQEGECVLQLNADGELLQDAPQAEALLQLDHPLCRGNRLHALLPGLTAEKLNHLLYHPGHSISLLQEFSARRIHLCARIRSRDVYEVLLSTRAGAQGGVEASQLTHRVLKQTQILEQARRWLSNKATAPFMVVCLEVARFKEINRQLGFMASAQLLKVLSQRLDQCLPAEALFGVLGAEQFAVLVPNTGAESDAAVMLQHLMQSFEEPIPLLGRPVLIPLFAGYTLVHATTPEVDAETLLQQAASAVHYQIRAGEAGVARLYDANLDEDISNRDKVENALFGALERNEFSLVYQPKVALASGRIVGAEALLRWKSSKLGIISPAIFIPMAEDNGLINIIGDWVLAAACAQVRVWRLQGVPTVPISVNLAAPQLRNQSLVSRVTGIINEAGSSPEDLKIELTETSLIQDIDASAERIEQLRSLGIGIALDDFGTGYSSLSYLNRLPIDVLKIDKCFIDEISPDDNRGRLVKHIINMAHDLGYEVIAEGVETQYQLDVLREYDCDIVQGYIYSAPVAADTLREMLREQPFEN